MISLLVISLALSTPPFPTCSNGNADSALKAELHSLPPGSVRVFTAGEAPKNWPYPSAQVITFNTNAPAMWERGKSNKIDQARTTVRIFIASSARYCVLTVSRVQTPEAFSGYDKLRTGQYPLLHDKGNEDSASPYITHSSLGKLELVDSVQASTTFEWRNNAPAPEFLETLLKPLADFNKLTLKAFSP